MIPNHKITNEVVLTDYLYNKPDTKLIDRSFGGIAIQDASEGLLYQVWEIYYESPFIKIKALTTGDIIVLDSIDKVTELSVAFDLNMNITYCYVANSRSYLKYYNTTTQDFSILELSGIRSPRLAYDDLREMQSSVSDIVYAYINSQSNYLCYRLLRDRYTIEYQLQQVPENARLVRVGMSKGLRLQFKMQLI